MSRFTTDSAVTTVAPGRYAASIDRGWWIERGPNGGYLAAILLRAVVVEVADPARRPRSLTLHYLRPPVEGACEVTVTLERVGRGLTTASARLVQDGRDCILALVALGVDRPGPELHDHPAPPVPPPEEAPARSAPTPDGPDIPFRHRFEVRPVIGAPPFTSGPVAETGGWIRTTDGDALDDVLLAAIHGLVAAGGLLAPDGAGRRAHHRADRALPGAPAPGSEWCLVRFRTQEVGAGYLEETGEVWSTDGRLLADSRQLGVILVPPGAPAPGH